MLNGLRRLDPVSERARRKLRDAERARFALAQERGALPSMREMEESTAGLRRARVAAFRQMHRTFRWTPPSAEACGSRTPLSDDRAADRAAGRRAPRDRRRDRAAAGAAAAKPVVALHYYCRMSLNSIGRQLNVSPQRVSQLHLRALERLRATLRADDVNGRIDPDASPGTLSEQRRASTALRRYALPPPPLVTRSIPTSTVRQPGHRPITHRGRRTRSRSRSERARFSRACARSP